MGVKWNMTTAKRIQDDTTVVSFITIVDRSMYNQSRRVQVDGQGSDLLQTVENFHIGF